MVRFAVSRILASLLLALGIACGPTLADEASDGGGMGSGGEMCPDDVVVSPISVSDDGQSCVVSGTDEDGVEYQMLCEAGASTCSLLVDGAEVCLCRPDPANSCSAGVPSCSLPIFDWGSIE